MANIICKYCGAENPENYAINEPFTDTYTYECINCSAKNTHKQSTMEILEKIPIAQFQKDNPFRQRIMGACTH